MPSLEDSDVKAIAKTPNISRNTQAPDEDGPELERRSSLTRQDKSTPKFPDLLRRAFTAQRANARWVGT